MRRFLTVISIIILLLTSKGAIPVNIQYHNSTAANKIETHAIEVCLIFSNHFTS